MLWLKKILKNDSEFLIALLILTTIVYAFSWWNEFVSDDIAGILQNPNLANFSLQLKTLSPVNILFSLIYKLFGPTPFWFHLLNTAFHLATVVVIYVLISAVAGLALLGMRLHLTQGATLSKVEPLRTKWLARLTSLLFALHPIETEGVTWISGLPYVAYSFFLLGGFLIFVLIDNSTVTHPWRTSLLTALFYGLGLLTSEKAIIFPLILFTYLLLSSRLSWQKVKLTLPSLGVGFLYGLTLLKQFGQRVEAVAPAYSGGPAFFNPLIQIPIAIYSYIKLLILPINLTLYHEYLAFPRWEYYLAVIITIFFLLSIVFSWRFNKLIAFGLLLFFISLTPTFLPISIGWVVAERYVHLGSVGIFLVTATVISFIIQNKRVQTVVAGFIPAQKEQATTRVVTTITVAFFLIYIPLTIKRNLEWRNQDSLWPATVRTSPYSAYAHNNMGDYYGRHGDIESSIREFEIARQLRPRYAEATHNLGNAYLKVNEATRAAALFKEALEYNPALYQSYQQLGQIALSTADYQAAENYFLQAIKINPDPFTDYLFLYMLYSKTNNKTKAEETLIFAHRLAGGNPERIQLIQQVVLQSIRL